MLTLKQPYRLMALLFIFVTSTIQVYASDIDASIYVDDQQKLHLMWQGSNENITTTSIKLTGPMSKHVDTLDSHYRFDNLIAGKYTITLTQGSNTSTYQVDIEAKLSKRLLSRLDAGVTLTTFEMKSFDDSAYPEFALSFQALDAGGNPIATLTSEDFSLSENNVDISDYVFRAPSGDEVTKIADVVVVFDDTGSMGGEITQLKNNVKSFADKLIEKGVDARFRLITYKDDANDGWAWTSDVEVFKTEIASLSASGGNNTPEDGFEAINIATDYSFRSGAQKVFLFITDAPSYEGTDEYGKPTPTKAEINQKLIDNGINLYAIAYGNSQYKGADSITEASGGKWYPISADFTDVVNEIGNTIGGIYQVAWSALDTLSDTLEIKLKHTDSSQEIAHTYIRNLAPKVTTFPDIARVVGNDITIGAEAIDVDNLIDATLMYREHKIDGTVAKWVSVKSLDDLNGRADFIIPGSAVTAAGLDYIVWFKDAKGAKGFSKKRVLTVGTSVVLPSFKVTSHTWSGDLMEWTFMLEFKNLAEAANLKFYFQGSLSGVFIGEAEREIKEGDSNVSYEKLGSGQYKITLKRSILSTPDGVINTGVIKIMAKIGDITIKGSGKEFDNPARVDLYVKRNANTFILTNFKAMSGEGVDALKDQIKELINKTWQIDNGIPKAKNSAKYNMLPVVIDLQDVNVMPDGVAHAFQESISTGLETPFEKVGFAKEITKRLSSICMLYSECPKTMIDTKLPAMYLNIIGGPEVIPYGIAYDRYKFGEGDWIKDSGKGIRGINNLFIGSKGSLGGYPSDATYRKYFKTGRLVEKSLSIKKLISNYIDGKGYLLGSKKLLNYSGLDHYEKGKEKLYRGFKSGENVDTYFKTNKVKNSTWGFTKSFYADSKKTDYSGKTVVNSLNNDAGIVTIFAHANHYIMDFGDTSNYFYAGRKEKLSDVTDINNLAGTAVMANGCHAGVNYSMGKGKTIASDGTDFPESFSDRELAVYIANTSFGVYVGGRSIRSGQIIENTMKNIVQGGYGGGYNPYNKMPIYNAYYYGGNSTVSQQVKRNDLFSRPQFYGISNYRVGPAPKKAEKKLAWRSVESLIAKKEIDTFATYARLEGSIDKSDINISLSFDARDNFNYDSINGRFNIVGISEYDEYDRPIMILNYPVPRGSTIDDIMVLDQMTVNKSYEKSISTEICNTEGCITDSLDTSSFAGMERYTSEISNGQLEIRLMPIQYNTSAKEALLTTMLSLKITIKQPAYIPDADNDGLPDYWEGAYGFDIRDPSDASIDPDKDGKTNEQEYAEQTNPRLDNRLANDITAPEVPTSLVATPRENAVDISFTAPADAVQVQFFYGVDSDTLTTASRKVLASDGKIDINGLEDEATYYVVARAYDASGNLSDASSVITFTIPKGVGPNLPQAPVLDDKTLVVTNPTDSDFNGYHLYISDKASMEGALSTFKLNDEGVESRIDLSRYFVEGESWYAQIVAVDNNNHEGTLSKVFELKTGSELESGDANADGKINSQDLIKIINHILGVETANGNPDCNADGSVNSLDTVCIINKILGT